MKYSSLFVMAMQALASCSQDHNLTPAIVQIITIPGDTILPESEAINPANGDLYVGSIHNGQI